MFFALRRSFVVASLIVPFAASTSFAQTPAPRPGATPAGKPLRAPVTQDAAPTTATGTPGVEMPPALTVNDPMLQPVPPATRSLASWEEALQLVRSRNTDLHIAYDEVLRAQAQQRVALAGALPTINGTVSATQNLITKRVGNDSSHIVGTLGGQRLDAEIVSNSPSSGPQSIPTPNYLSASATLVQPIIALRAWHQIKTTAVAERAAELSVEDLKRNIALGVANAIVGVVTAERVAELNRIGLRAALERLELTQRKRALGAANGLDVVRAQQDVASARATLVTGDESLRQSRESLGLALGYPDAFGVAPGVDMNGLERSAMQACRVAPSLDERADIKASRTKVEVAQRNIDDAWLQFAPTLNGQSTVATSTNTSGSQFSPPTTWNIMAVLNVPIWDGGARYGFLRDTRALADEAQQNLESLRRNAQIQLNQARRGVAVATDARNVAAETRALAAENDRLTQTAYREGQGTSLELVIAASALRQADVTLALREFDLVKARVLAVLALATCPW